MISPLRRSSKGKFASVALCGAGPAIPNLFFIYPASPGQDRRRPPPPRATSRGLSSPRPPRRPRPPSGSGLVPLGGRGLAAPLTMGGHEVGVMTWVEPTAPLRGGREVALRPRGNRPHALARSLPPACRRRPGIHRLQKKTLFGPVLWLPL